MSFAFRVTGDVGSFFDPTIKDGPAVVDGVVTPLVFECEGCGDIVTWDRAPEAARFKSEFVSTCADHCKCGGRR